MVVYEWFARLGNILAPDPKQTANVESFDAPVVAKDSDTFSLWNVLAPDPNFTVTTANGSASALSDGAAVTDDATATVTVTATAASTSSSPSTIQSQTPVDEGKATSIALYTPSPFRQHSQNPKSNEDALLLLSSLQSPRVMKPYSNADLEQQVVSAAKDRANAMASPVLVLRASVTAFRICKNTTTINSTVRKKLMDLLHNDESLLSIRSSGPQYECPDGYTIFMTATYANQIGAMEVIWEYATKVDRANEGDTIHNSYTKNTTKQHQLLSSRNLEGKSVYHIAAERGHVEALEFILNKHREVYGTDYDPVNCPPVDLMGHTPLGSVLLSPEVKAKQNKTVLIDKLYHENDQSLIGSPLPVQQRIVPLSVTSATKSNYTSSSSSNTTIRAIAGMSEMPGKRVLMEDCTICCATDTAMIVAVCDGHSDLGHVSHYVAESFVTGIKERLPTLLAADNGTIDTSTLINPDTASWEYVCTDICLHIDEALEATTTLRGGSVAVFMVITAKKIVVSNVGDCRCILIQSKTNNKSTDLVKETKQLSVSETESSTSSIEKWMEKYEVQALSTDHKPNIPSEHDRIKKNGLKVVAEKVNDQLTIHKISYKDNKLATSRAFGDFEYKSNENYELHEQAVIALPEIVTHVREGKENITDQFLIAACDGIWDVMTNEDVGMFVTQRIEHYFGKSSSKTAVDATILPIIADELIVECLHRGSEDNMSVVIVALSNMADRILNPNAEDVPGSIVSPKVLTYDSTGVV